MAGSIGSTRRKRRRSARVAIALTAIVAVLLFISGQSNPNLLDDGRRQVESVTSPIVYVLGSPVRATENFFTDLKNRANAHSENARLKQELAQLKDVEARANAMAIKLSRFENILNVDASSGIPEQKIAARAVTEQHGPFVRSALLNVGANKGIKPGHAVMTTDGFLGHVVRVGPRSSRVLHAEDLNSRIAVMSQRSEARAIMTGQNSPFPTLSFIRDGDDWREGDLIVTSGDEGVLPFGLPIGTSRIDQSGQIYVELFASRKPVDWVWVYPFEPILPPEESGGVANDEGLAETDAASPDQASVSEPESTGL